MAEIEVRDPQIFGTLNPSIRRQRPPQHFRRHVAIIPRVPGRQGVVQLAKFAPVSSMPSLGTRTHGSMAG